ncbi:uncharacterized protein LOC130500732 [Raphanus sativus]|uniref:Uncharacterized protein LOC130500732 n=1 Tax=Raphanus sativus TaxID=3726 RepID=A0A9W3CJC6_RAPSA|nr:uncharacterized protein LOC130500732 [Raphanus sativus]
MMMKRYITHKSINCFENEEKEWLMVRPSYPPHYQERKVRKIEADQAPLVVVHGSWKVGDLVDWWKDDCFWCAIVLAAKMKEPLQIELFPPPLGEGETYAALHKDVRPTLDWSLEDGWTVPSKDGRKSQSVKLVKREKGVDHVPQDVCQTGKEQTEKAKRQKTEREPRRRQREPRSRRQRGTRNRTGPREKHAAEDRGRHAAASLGGETASDV